MTGRGRVLKVAVPSPLRQTFDYLPCDDREGRMPAPGARVRIPFGRTTKIGVVVEHADQAAIAPGRLKRIEAVIDREALLPAELLDFLCWGAEYFHHPIGDAILSALPARLRQGRDLPVPSETRWRLTATGESADAEVFSRAPRQAAIWHRLRDALHGRTRDELACVEGDWRRALDALIGKGFVETFTREIVPVRAEPNEPAVALNTAQAEALERILQARGRFETFLLDGVTGSGKTEVYLSLIERIVADGRQALVLIPEIGLTPQIVSRFERRFAGPIAVLHSGLADGERLESWAMARSGRADVIIGTRSAVFVPLTRPGVIIVDEEHDLSFKQQDGFRYSARDLATVRAHRAQVPVVLGSATPSLESLNNVERGRYHELRLPARALDAKPPRVEVLDLRGRPFDDGLSRELIEAIERGIDNREQSLLFLNRRGYAPILMCHGCGWLADCQRCDAHLVYHRDADRLRCHHCGTERATVVTCPDCSGAELLPFGLGTERVAEALARRIPRARIGRMDRDSTRRRGSLEEVLRRIHAGELDVVVGTQMLAKGHHFPNVTLVGILDADGGLFGADFRSAERMAQLLVQVAGRAGRGDQLGRVMIQTHHPDHPLLQVLVLEGYRRFGEAALEERRLVGLPPFVAHALLRAEAPSREAGQRFLETALAAAQRLGVEGVRMLGPVPAPMERRAGRFRAQLLLEAPQRGSLHALLDRWVPELEAMKEARRVRWSLDVDPLEML